ncbi:MAG: methyltransferase domain-containing protein [Pyrinomonadaceae bacterium]
MVISFTRRSESLERLDTGDYTPEEYGRWLGEMRVIHNFFGEIRALKKTLLKEIEDADSDRVSLLDVGAGSGYILGELSKQMNGRRAFFVGVEINAEAAASVPAFGALPVQGDGTRLPFADAQFDHAFCTLMLHHLRDEDAVKLLAEMARVSRGKIFVVDPNRDRTAYYMYKLFAPVFFQRLTVEDGALSILRSRTADELHALATEAGLQKIEVVRSRLNRLVLSASRNHLP